MRDFYQTDDILLAAYLLCRGALFHEATSDRPQHFIFVFQDFQKCEELKREYLNNGLAPARELFARREELMGAMRDRYGHRKSYGNQY